MNRKDELLKLNSQTEWDFVVIGGGASGLGVALDAASRGYKTLLVEAFDFAKGTSSRSTKLVHGGVRYLAQGNIKLVSEALKERGLLANNAAHLVKRQAFIIPHYSWWEGFYYLSGLRVYDILSGNRSFGRTRSLNGKFLSKKIPTLKTEGLVGGISYYDGQFDDSRLAIDLANSIVREGGCILNYMKVVELIKDQNEKLQAVVIKDQFDGSTHEIKSKVIINATGVFANDILKLDKPEMPSMIAASQGIHLVLDKSFLKSEYAIMIPKTSDGRVLFVIPWHNHTLVGTTDTAMPEVKNEPRALDNEIQFILETADKYLSKSPQLEDVKSVFAGLRPLVRPQGNQQKTKEISRGHKVIISDSGMISVIGGKWTTYRKMAEDTVNKAVSVSGLDYKKCRTESLSIHANFLNDESPIEDHLDVYGSLRQEIDALCNDSPEFGMKIHPNHPYIIAQVIWAIRYEMAETIEDVLARRIRLLFLDARAAIDSAELVAKIIRQEKGYDIEWEKAQIEQFIKLADGYLI